MKKFSWILIYTILGITFWIPSVVIHAIRGADFGASRFDIILITILPIVTALLTLQIVDRSRLGHLSRASIASWMLLGIWFFGPYCMLIPASFSAGDFSSSEAWPSLVSATLLFVPYTFVMSTYDGTLGALLVVTIWFFVIGAMGVFRRLRGVAKSAG